MNAKTGKAAIMKTNSVPRRADNVALGMGVMLISVLVAPLIDVFSKLAAVHMPSAEVTFFRFLFQSILMLPLVLWNGSWRQFSWKLTGYHALRGGILCVSMIAFVTSLTAMALADAIAIFFVEPIILTILGSVFLKETIGWRRYVACAVGFLGAMIIIRPSFEEIGWVALLPVVTAVGIAVFALLTRVLAHREEASSMQFQTGIWGGVFSLLILAAGNGTGSAIFDPVVPSLDAVLLALGVGIWATFSGFLAVYAYRNAPASTLAPLQYFEIVCATIFGWLVFHDFPDVLKWLGIAIIIASGLYIIWRERVTAARKAAQAADSVFTP